MTFSGKYERTILVVDDSRVVLEVTRAALESVGYRVLTRSRAAGCVGAILQEKPDLVLVDVNMPGMGGDAVVRLFGQAQPNSKIVVLLYSSMDEDALRIRAAGCGADGYVLKSESSDALIKQINHWLDPWSNLGNRPRGTVSDQWRRFDTQQATSPPNSVVRSNSDGERPEASGARPVAESTPATVLFVDDDMIVLSAYRRVMQAEGLEVEFALSGERALARILSAEPPHVVVCDVHMPTPNGLEVYTQAREADPSWAQRFIFLTGAKNDPEIRALRERFAGPIFYKPADEQALRASILRCVINAVGRKGSSRTA